jgi:hypothetical protein
MVSADGPTARIRSIVHRGDRTSSHRVRSPFMKKLMILAVLVALGVVAAKRLRPS